MNTRSRILICSLTFTFLSACEYEPYKQGKQLYETHCANCHSEDGSGLEQLIPDITNSSYYSENKNQLACIIRQGIPATDSSLIMDMPPAKTLSHFEISNIKLGSRVQT